jgi:hypothetical protein
MGQVDQLYRYQQIENELKQDKHRLTQVVRLQVESELLLAARRRTEATAAELQEWRTRQTNLNLELTGLNDKV